MKKLGQIKVPKWIRWVLFVAFTCLWLLWFSGFFEGFYDPKVELTDYAKQVLEEEVIK
jgi:site-specific recombinase